MNVFARTVSNEVIQTVARPGAKQVTSPCTPAALRSTGKVLGKEALSLSDAATKYQTKNLDLIAMRASEAGDPVTARQALKRQLATSTTTRDDLSAVQTAGAWLSPDASFRTRGLTQALTRATTMGEAYQVASTASRSGAHDLYLAASSRAKSLPLGPGPHPEAMQGLPVIKLTLAAMQTASTDRGTAWRSLEQALLVAKTPADDIAIAQTAGGYMERNPAFQNRALAQALTHCKTSTDAFMVLTAAAIADNSPMWQAALDLSKRLPRG